MRVYLEKYAIAGLEISRPIAARNGDKIIA